MSLILRVAICCVHLERARPLKWKASFPALTMVYAKANSVVSSDVSCPTWLHKYIIGKKGASIQKLTCDLPKVASVHSPCQFTICYEGINVLLIKRQQQMPV
jgi:hypothetical protein